MVRLVFFAVLLAVAAVGCDRQEDPFLRKVENEADKAIRRLHEPNVRDPFLWVDKLIESKTNRAVRAACLRILHDKLCEVRLVGDDYKQQRLVFGDVWVRLLPYRWNEAGRWTIEDECRAKVRQIAWMRRELDRWKAMAADGEADRLKKKDPAKFDSWRSAYRQCLRRYESYVASLERTFDSDCKSCQATVEERSRAKSLMEAFLGRPMRTREEVLRDRLERKTSDEMRALQ